MSALADEAWAVRVPETVFAVVTVLLVALVTRELGGGRLAQALAAWGYAFASFPLVFGHVALTSGLDGLAWVAATLCVVRAIGVGGARSRAGGWRPARSSARRRPTSCSSPCSSCRSRSGWRRSVRGGCRGGSCSAGSRWRLCWRCPALAYQATHGWPQLAMGQRLSAKNGPANRALMLPFLLPAAGAAPRADLGGRSRDAVAAARVAAGAVPRGGLRRAAGAGLRRRGTGLLPPRAAVRGLRRGLRAGGRVAPRVGRAAPARRRRRGPQLRRGRGHLPAAGARLGAGLDAGAGHQPVGPRPGGVADLHGAGRRGVCRPARRRALRRPARDDELRRGRGAGPLRPGPGAAHADERPERAVPPGPAAGLSCGRGGRGARRGRGGGEATRRAAWWRRSTTA